MRLITNKKESEIAVNILVETYANAPNINWMFTQSHKNLKYFFYVLIEDAIKKKGAYLTSNNSGVLLLYNLKTKYFSLSSIFRKAYLIFFIMGIKKSIQVLKLNNIKSKHRPKIGFYGAVLAIKNDKHQWSTRLELKKDILLMFKNLNLPIYVETTNRRIYLLYKKLGLTKYYEMNHPYADLNIYFMKTDKL